MTDAARPPLPSPRPERPAVPLAATCLTIVVGAGMLVAVCGGAVVMGVSRAAQPRVVRARAERAAAVAKQELVADAQAQLDALAARVAAEGRDAGELPEALAEAPPKDPWGHRIAYTRRAPDRAVLRSAGPDGRFGTRDDVVRDVAR